MRTLSSDSPLLSRLRTSLPPTVSDLFQAVVQTAQDLGMPLFLVGGSVRDLLRNDFLTDLDVAVEGDAIALGSKAADETGARLTSHRRFGVAKLALGGSRIDVATTRTEVYPRPGALPKVTPSDILLDLRRRDFTVNALALALTGENAGTLLDPLGGENDLADGLVRALHPRSFIDDPTRLFRAVRFETRLGLSFESETETWIQSAVRNRTLDTVSGDRIRKELQLTFTEPDPSKTLRRLHDVGVLAAVHPSLGEALTPALSQRESELADSRQRELPEGRLRARELLDDAGLGSTKPSPLLWLALIAYGVSPAEGTAIIQRLRMPGRWAKTFMDTLALASRPEQDLVSMSPEKLARCLDTLSPHSVEAVSMLTPSSNVADALRRYLKSWRNVKPALTGRDLAALGAEQGPMMGDLIKKLKEARIAGLVRSKEEETELARQSIAAKGG